MRIPPDQEVIPLDQLSRLFVLKAAAKHLIDRIDLGIHAAFALTQARFAQSAHAVCRLQPSTPRSTVNPSKAMLMLKKRGFRLRHLLEAATISKTKIETLLGAEDIEKICEPAKASEPYLVIEAKPGVPIDVEHVERLILKAIDFALMPMPLSGVEGPLAARAALSVEGANAWAVDKILQSPTGAI